MSPVSSTLDGETEAVDVSSMLDGETEAVDGACVLGRTAPNAPGTEEETRTLGETVDVTVTNDAAEEEARGEARALISVGCPGREARALGSPVGAADTDVAAAEEETRGEACALGSPVEAADTGVAAAEVEACGEARALGRPVEDADTDVAAAAGEDTSSFALVK